MKREILFRGKRIDNGDWVYGDLIHNIDCVKVRERETDINRIAKSYEVIPETVGQFTGSTDKNGKKIFEGDIVVCRYANEYTPVFQNGIYMAYNPKEMQTIQQPSTQFNIIWRNGCEVIGTIFDKEGV